MQGNTTMPTVRKRFDDRTSSAGMKSGYLFLNYIRIICLLIIYLYIVHRKVA